MENNNWITNEFINNLIFIMFIIVGVLEFKFFKYIMIYKKCN